MSDIDEVSRKLGQFEATLQQHGGVHAVMLAKLDRIDEKLTVQNGSIAKAHARIDATEVVGKDFIDTKKKGILALIGLSLAGGAGASGVLKVLAVFAGAQ